MGIDIPEVGLRLEIILTIIIKHPLVFPLPGGIIHFNLL